jgi:putative transposase
MSKIVRNYEYRIYPTPTQARELDRLMSLGWRTYNDALHTRIQHYKETGESLSHYNLRDIMAASRNENPAFKAVMSPTVDALCKRVIDSYTGTFSRIKSGANGKDAGFPDFKRRRDFCNLPFRYGVGVKLFPDTKYKTTLRFTGVGQVKMHYHRPIPDGAVIKRVMILQGKRDKWYAVLTLDIPTETLPEYPTTGRMVGIDIGMVYLLALSDGATCDNPKWYQTTAKRRRVLQRKLDRQRRANNPNNYNPDGTVKENVVIWRKSNRMRRTEDALRKLDEEVARRRKHYWHEKTDWLTKTYDFIALEALTLEFMQQNKRLAVGVYDAAYRTFWDMLKYKAEERGVTLAWVPPAYSSQTCSACGHKAKENRKTQANFACVSCGHRENADTNAAKNILQWGLDGRCKPDSA